MTRASRSGSLRMDLSRLSLTGWSSLAAASTLPEGAARRPGQRGRDAGADRGCFAPAAAPSRRERSRRSAAGRRRLRLPDQRREPEAADRAGARAPRRPARPAAPRLAALAAHFADDCPSAAGRPRGAGALRHRLPPPLPARRRHRLRDRRRAARRRRLALDPPGERGGARAEGRRGGAGPDRRRARASCATCSTARR